MFARRHSQFVTRAMRFVVLCALCLVAACAGTAARDPRVAAPAYETVACPKPNIAGFADLDFPAGVQCGYLTVLENRAKPEGRRIRIFVMRAPAASATPKADPVVYLSGGPGGAGSFEVASMLKHGLNAERDVIFVDQRGTHRADPRLACPAWEQFGYDAVSLPFAADTTTAGDVAAVKACRDRLVAEGHDIAAYNTTENAADIAELRAALRIDRWNVYGVSYGTKLALTVLRDHPQGIRSVVLDSVSPPTNNIAETWWDAPASAFKAIFAACASQPACAAAHPRLEADFTATVNRLDAAPAIVALKDESGRTIDVNVDGFAFVYALVMATERGDVANIPKMIAETARGNASAVAAYYLALRGPREFIGLGGTALALTVFCTEHANLTSEAATLVRSKAAMPALPDRVLKIQPKQGRLFAQCPQWSTVKAPPRVGSRIVSDVPVLIVEGAFDAATAPGWVDLIRPDLPRSQYVVFPYTGHGVLGKSTCAVSVVNAFLDAPGERVDATCAARTRVTFAP